MPEYDVIVIGAGTAGYAAATILRESGASVAIVEKELVGGVCNFWGCMPSKTLLRPGTVAWEASHSAGVEQPTLQWRDIARSRDTIVHEYRDEPQVEHLEKAGVVFHRGKAQIVGSGAVQVSGQILHGRHLIVATGSVASIPPIDGLLEAGFWTNREATELKEIPGSIVVIGGGAIGCELGQMVRNYGAEVTLVEESDHLLDQENPDAARYLQDQFAEQGIVLQLGCRATKIEQRNGQRILTLDNGQIVTGEAVLVATGRTPVTEHLGLDCVGVQIGKQGIQIDNQCRAAEGVWAVGDVVGAGFTHVADYQAQIAADDIMGHSRLADYRAIPRIAYTDPEIAAVGIAESSKAPEGMEIITAGTDLATGSRTVTYGQDYTGQLCVFADRKEQVLVGAWAVGPLASEWIQFATLAIRARVPISVLDDTMLAFPTFMREYMYPLHQLKTQL